jgi:hypothetical protein
MLEIFCWYSWHKTGSYSILVLTFCSLLLIATSIQLTLGCIRSVNDIKSGMELVVGVVTSGE